MSCNATTKRGAPCRGIVPAGEVLCAAHRGLLTAADVAERYGVSVRTVRTWCREGCPTQTRGWQGKVGPLFDAGAVDDWVERRTREDVKLSEALCMKLDAQSTKQAKVLEQLGHDYLPAAGVDRAWEAECRRMRRRLERVPRELAPEIMAVLDGGPAAVGQVLDAAAREILTELANGDYDPAPVEPSVGGVPEPPPVRTSGTVRQARAQLATLQALILETRNRLVPYELRSSR